ncbi:hypothetical protein IX296_003005 [Bacteroides pyogenes]|nr:hypothetical protein [Bacteroides pyogenes]MBR8739991.1 hypothetical protein [Bacteroides pyogenes]MBR8755771.1 hypothetical protein [Bacteroides pyogenes]MBR8797091.1 hypothetical protein [Bacteroides pyogenes]MBR8810684.1 hypothetical protein [Bacteroides pyogenes]
MRVILLRKPLIRKYGQTETLSTCAGVSMENKFPWVMVRGLPPLYKTRTAVMPVFLHGLFRLVPCGISIRHVMGQNVCNCRINASMWTGTRITDSLNILKRQHSPAYIHTM